MYSHIARYGEPQTQGAQSLIENRQPLGDDIDQHFVEWFSGDALDSIWSTRDGGGSGGSVAMTDGTNGGLTLTTGTTNGHRKIIDFNQIRHYDIGCVQYAIWNANSATDIDTNCGFKDVADVVASNGDHMHIRMRSALTTDLTNNAGSGATGVDTNESVDTNVRLWRIQLSSTHSRAHANGSLVAINTSTLPTTKMEPWFASRTKTTSAKSSAIRYMECYQTV
jgi:hypothetical protein